MGDFDRDPSLMKELSRFYSRTVKHPNGVTWDWYSIPIPFFLNINCKFCGIELITPHRVLKHMSECDADILVEFKTLCDKLNYLISEPLDKCYLCGKSCLPEVLGDHWMQCHPRIGILFHLLVDRLNICDDPDFRLCFICGERNSMHDCVTHMCNNHTQYLPYLYRMSMEMIGSNPKKERYVNCKLCRNLLPNKNKVTEETFEKYLHVFDSFHQFYYRIILACMKNEDLSNTEETCTSCGEVFLLINYVEHLGKKHPFTVCMYGSFFRKRNAFIERKTCTVCDKKLPLSAFMSHFETEHPQLLIIKNQLSSSYIAEIETNIRNELYKGKTTVDCEISDVSDSTIDEFQNIKNNEWQPIVKVKPLDLEAWAKSSISHTSGTCVKWQPVVQIEQMNLDKLIPEKKRKVFVKKHPTLKTISYSKKELLRKRRTLKDIKYSKNQAFKCLSKLHSISTRNLKKQLKSYSSNEDKRNDSITKWISDVQYSCSSNVSNLEENDPMIESPIQEPFYLQAHTNDKETDSNKPDERMVLQNNEIVDTDDILNYANQRDEENASESNETDDKLKNANKPNEENAPESNETLPKVPEIRIIIPGTMNKFEKEKVEEIHDKIDDSQVEVVKTNRRTIKTPRRLDDYVLDCNKTSHVKDQVVHAGKMMNAMENRNIRKELAKKVLKCQKRLTKYVSKYEDILDEFKLNLIHARKIITSASIGNAFMKQMDLIVDKHVRKNIKTLLRDLIEALTESKKIKRCKKP